MYKEKEQCAVHVLYKYCVNQGPLEVKASKAICLYESTFRHRNCTVKCT